MNRINSENIGFSFRLLLKCRVFQEFFDAGYIRSRWNAYLTGYRNHRSDEYIQNTALQAYIF